MTTADLCNPPLPGIAAVPSSFAASSFAEQIAERGWGTVDGFLPGPAADELRRFVLEQKAAGNLRYGKNKHEGPVSVEGSLDFYGSSFFWDQMALYQMMSRFSFSILTGLQVWNSCLRWCFFGTNMLFVCQRKHACTPEIPMAHSSLGLESQPFTTTHPKSIQVNRPQNTPTQTVWPFRFQSLIDLQDCRDNCQTSQGWCPVKQLAFSNAWWFLMGWFHVHPWMILDDRPTFVKHRF